MRQQVKVIADMINAALGFSSGFCSHRGFARRVGTVAVAVLPAVWAGAVYAADPALAVTRSTISTAPAALAPEPQLFRSVSHRQPAFPGSAFESEPLQLWAPSRARVQLFEAPRGFTPGQEIRRSPRLALGFRSEGLRSAMEAIGIDAQNCTAPILRLRGKMADNGDVSGTFWISARCSFR